MTTTLSVGSGLLEHRYEGAAGAEEGEAGQAGKTPADSRRPQMGNDEGNAAQSFDVIGFLPRTGALRRAPQKNARQRAAAGRVKSERSALG